ncbi:unnamed protein product [Ectocarpus sp. CCAP 1310/34]|nr:unnamed protein product [Ectocarpus sp. CCAP 1310/34]
MAMKAYIVAGLAVVQWTPAQAFGAVSHVSSALRPLSCRAMADPMSQNNKRSVSRPRAVIMASDEVEQRSPVAGSLLRALTGPYVSLGVGVGILLAVLANRIATPELVDSQARTDILGVIASGGLVTNGVYLLDLKVKEAEEVTLVGTFVQEYADDLAPGARRDLQWLGESLLLVSPATSMLVYQDGKTLARVGVMGESADIRDAPILRKCIGEGRDGREQYLAALQTLPGKVEFDYLPENCQAVLMLPVLEGSAVVVVGTNRARAFTPKDIVWMKGLCNQAALSLREAVVA